MPDRNQIKSFAWSSDTYQNGEYDYNNSRAELTDIFSVSGGKTAVRAVVDTEDHRQYKCVFVLSADDKTVCSAACTCSAPCDKFGYCRHVCAALLEYSSAHNPASETPGSSPSVKYLINGYSTVTEEEEPPPTAVGSITLEPHLYPSYSRNEMFMSVKIGREKMYVVNNLYELIMRFRTGRYHSYGKNLAFTHSFEALDEKGRQIFDFIVSALSANDSRYSVSSKTVDIKRSLLKNFFDIYKGSSIFFDDEEYGIIRRDPDIVLEFDKKEPLFILSCKNNYEVFGSESFSVFADTKNKKLYIASRGFSQAVFPIYSELAEYERISISPADIGSFCASVVSAVKKYVLINGEDILGEYIPPEAVARLYLDSPDANTIFGRLDFTYGNVTYPAFSGITGRVSNIRAEKTAERDVLKFLKRRENDPVHPLEVSGSDDIYRLFSEGISFLSKNIEIYASDKFKAMKIRPPVRPALGVTPNKDGLLSLTVSAEGYDIKELVKVLASYRKGKKYHRLRDGSFVDLNDEGIREFADAAEALNISDKDFLKKNINVPKYRMLYLDSLAENVNGLRIRRSEEFKKITREYNESFSGNYVVPEGITGELRPYQEYGFKWLKTIADFGFGGILADDMGLGKTLQSIALILSEKEKRGGKIKCLVVCPSSLVLNWESEINRFAPSLTVVPVMGTASVRSSLIADSDNADILITSYSSLLRDIVCYEDILFDFELADEAQFIKNHSTQASKVVRAVRAKIRFALTGTPVENSLAELWSIFDFIMPEYLYGYTYFKSNFETPIVKNSDENSLGELQRLTSPFILRRLKKDVLTELPEKTETIIAEEMTDEQKKLYTANVLSIKKTLKEKFAQANPETGKIEILAMLTRLRQICCDPSLVYENYTGGSAKLECCMDLIEGCIGTGHKILLFSQFTSMLAIIEKRLAAEKIPYFLLTGQTRADERIRLVNSFNTDNTKVFLISLKAGGTGLNLTGADIVIHYDPWWNISAENQAADRAYRIGQKNSVSVYKLITKNTIEENIQKLQQNKKELADMAVAGDGSIMKMSAADIMSVIE